MDDFQKIRFYDLMATPTSEHALKNSNVQKIIYSKNLHFDLVILEDFFQESWLMFAYKFDAPVITICKIVHLLINFIINNLKSYLILKKKKKKCSLLSLKRHLWIF